jgi:uncharacterized lipoprotein YddW (UPF0748 family)
MKIIETRGVWLTTTDSNVFKSREIIAEAMNFLAESGFNVVFPVVWNKAMTLYPSQIMREIFDVEINPSYAGRDPLEEVVTEAHRCGLKVIPWFEYGFACSYNLNGGMLLAKKPQWAGCDRHGNLLKKNNFEWLNALDVEVQDFLLSLVLEVVKNYDVDGIQGDDRLPALPSEGGYDQKTVELYRQQFCENPPDNHQDLQWLKWRADILTQFLERLYQQVKAVNPNLIVSMAPSIHDWAFREYLQDAPTWLEKKIVDIIHPQIYRRDFGSYKSIVDRLVNEQFTGGISRLAPGVLMKVGDYHISSEYLVQAVEYNRDRGIWGEVFFFYEGLRANDNALAKALRKSVYTEPATFPSLLDLSEGRISQNNSIWEWLQMLWRNLF